MLAGWLLAVVARRPRACARTGVRTCLFIHSRIPISEVRRVYNGVEYSETLHRYTQKAGRNWDHAKSSNCLSFFAGSTDSSSRTYDFICDSAVMCALWVQFLDPRGTSSAGSVAVE